MIARKVHIRHWTIQFLFSFDQHDMERILVDNVKRVLKMKKADFYTIPADEADARKSKDDADRREKGMPMNFQDMVEMMKLFPGFTRNAGRIGNN